MSDFKKLKEGSILSESQYYKVQKISGDRVQLATESGEPVVVDSKYVESFLMSAHDFKEEKKITKTEMAEVFLSHPRVAMTVCFNKQVKEADVVKEIMTAYEGTAPKEAEKAMKAAVKKGLNGEERVMIGRHHGGTDDFGRIHFVDMEQEKGTKAEFDGRSRLVDPRTLNWVIVNNVKYLIK
jgi:hypothetical protein